MTDAAMAEGRLTEALDRFECRNDPNGRFLRYCHGRSRRAGSRFLLAALGAGTFAALHDPVQGLVILLAVLAGEALDSAVLRTISRRYDGHRPAPRLARICAAVAAAAQGAAVSLALALLWVWGQAGETVFLASAFFIGAGLDAGTALGFFSAAAIARLAVLCSTFLILIVREIWHDTFVVMLDGRHGFDVVANLILVLLAVQTIRYILHTRDRRTGDARAIFAEQERLVSSQRSLEAAAAEARLLAVVAQHANDGVVIYAPDGKVAWVNQTFSRITGYPADKLIGHRIEEVIPADDLDPTAIAKLIQARLTLTPCRTELRTRRGTGEEIWIEVNLTPIPGPDGAPTAMLAVEREITEAKRREAELARAREEAEAAARAKARFLATMSHELRTPMNGVIGTAELLADTELDTDQRFYVDTIVDSGRALLTIINDILDLSRLQSGAPVIAARPFDLTDCIARAAELLRPSAKAKGLALNVVAPSPALPALAGDEGRLRQIVINLLGNAIKFTEGGSVALTLTARPDGDRQAIEVAVADTGIGIPADRIGAIFDSFTQADDDVGRKFGGTGLGLTISRKLAQLMGGDIAVTSTPGAGSVFTLTVSLAVAEATPARDPAQPPPVLRLPGRKRSGGEPLKVLLVEDNRTNALIVQRMLAPSGVELVLAADGGRAVELFRDAAPDIVFMDLSMPGKTGFEAAREMRAMEGADAPRCPIVALTAHALEDARAACIAAGFDGFVTKPVSRDALLSELARHVA